MDEESTTFREAGRVAEGEGCAYIALHGRTAEQMYSGKARWELIGELKEMLSIPVLGNGDIFAAPDALLMMEKTGCDGVVIGRGCLGNPWLFRNLKRLFDGTAEPENPDLGELVRVIREHYQLLLAHNADYPKLAVLQLRKFGGWYIRGVRGSSRLRSQFQKMETARDLENILEQVLEAGLQAGFPDPRKPTRDATP
jgi:tRNA-dihydrouridine synthase